MDTKFPRILQLQEQRQSLHKQSELLVCFFGCLDGAQHDAVFGELDVQFDGALALAQQQGRRAGNGRVTAKLHTATSMIRIAFMRGFYANLGLRSNCKKELGCPVVFSIYLQACQLLALQCDCIPYCLCQMISAVLQD